MQEYIYISGLEIARHASVKRYEGGNQDPDFK
jgi:hypothetical protein